MLIEGIKRNFDGLEEKIRSNRSFRALADFQLEDFISPIPAPCTACVVLAPNSYCYGDCWILVLEKYHREKIAKDKDKFQ